jgi:hypothetical protein
MTHSQMLKTRRTKQRTKKQLAGLAKRAKKLMKQDVKVASADAGKKDLP